MVAIAKEVAWKKRVEGIATGIFYLQAWICKMFSFPLEKINEAEEEMTVARKVSKSVSGILRVNEPVGKGWENVFSVGMFYAGSTMSSSVWYFQLSSFICNSFRTPTHLFLSVLV